MVVLKKEKKMAVPTLRVGEEFRYPYLKKGDVIEEYDNGVKNHFYVTSRPGHYVVGEGEASVILTSGINPIGAVNGPDKSSRIPAIAIRSTPHKVGSSETPWKDSFDIDNGHIHYYGDNKTPGKDPAKVPGNKALLALYEQHSSDDAAVRLKSAPLIFYKAVSSGLIKFQGYGVIRGVTLVAQHDVKNNQTFMNYAFDFTVLSLNEELDYFDWQWVLDRRDPIKSIEEAIAAAPAAWKDWVANGSSSLDRNKRRVSKLLTVKTDAQIPEKNSVQEGILKAVYDYYSTNPSMKKRFEAMAAFVAQRYLSKTGQYEPGWLTAASSDGGADFYGVLNIGEGFGRSRLIVLGQAKCEQLHAPTGGNHIARTVARLKRGWIGIYVTTSFFSESVQREVIEDQQPINLINGLKIAEILNQEIYDTGKSLDELIKEIDDNYESLVMARRPEELLLG